MTLRLSATSLSTFDVDTAFGCKRKWWFKYVQKLPEEQGPGALLGDRVHKRIEKIDPAATDDIAQMLEPAAQWVNEVHMSGWHLEVKVDDARVLPGFNFTGRIDALNSERKIIRDWKTMRTLQYAKPSMMLQRDLQMQLYAACLAEPGEEITIEHINITTQRPYTASRTFAVSTEAARQVVIDKALALGEGMRIYTSISDVNDTEPDRSKCRFCSFKDRCPTGEKTMDLLSTILGNKPAEPKPETKPAAPTGILPPEVQKEAFQAVPPPRSTPPQPNLPDAKPKKELLIQDVPSEPTPAPEVLSARSGAPSTVDTSTATASPAASDEAPKRGRGRPAGSKNKPKDEPAEGAPALDITSISVTRSATVQVVQFEPMRIEVTATANVHGLALADAVQQLDSQVLTEVIKRMQEMQAAKVGGK